MTNKRAILLAILLAGIGLMTNEGYFSKDGET